MRLYWTPASPFTRKVCVAARELGLWDRIEIAPTKWPLDWGYKTVPFTAGLADSNPVARIPTLVTDDGAALGCSTLACQYLDALGGGGLTPNDPWTMWSLYAVADGLIEAQILMRAEMLRPEAMRMENFLQKQRDRIDRCFDHIEAHSDELVTGADGGPPDLAEITVGIAASYQDWRVWLDDFRPGRPKLAAWHNDFRQRPAMVATEPAETPEA